MGYKTLSGMNGSFEAGACDETIKFIGCSGIYTSVSYDPDGAIIDICYTGAIGSGSGCAVGYKTLSGDLGSFEAGACDETIKLIGCSGIHTTVSYDPDGAVIDICYTGETGCAVGYKTLSGMNGSFEAGACDETIKFIGCSGIYTSVSYDPDGAIIDICYTGAIAPMDAQWVTKPLAGIWAPLRRGLATKL